MTKLLALLLSATPVVLTFGGKGLTSPTTGNLLTAAESGGGGIPAAACTAFGATDQAGAWWCLNGDGTMAAGSSTTLSLTGVSSVRSWPVGSGLTLRDASFINDTGALTGNYYVSPTVAAPTGSFTTCMLQNTQVVVPSTANTAGTLVMYSDLTQPNITWEMFRQNGANGLSSICTPACGTTVSTQNSTTAQMRTWVLECSVFTASTSTKSCTYTEAAGLTCSTLAHAVATVTNTARKWSVGLLGQDSQAIDYFNGFVGGAFFTEKALSNADMIRLGVAMLPGAPAGQTFTRASVAQCCSDPADKCIMLANDVPCKPGLVSRQEIGITNTIATNAERLGDVWANDGQGVAAPVRTANQSASPFGAKVAYSFAFAATTGGQQSRTYLDANESSAVLLYTMSVYVRGVSGSGTIDLCAVGNTNACTACAYTSTAWSRCSLTSLRLGAGTAMTLGNLSGVNGGIARAAQTVYLEDAQVEQNAAPPGPTSFISQDGNVAARATETCTGTGC